MIFGWTPFWLSQKGKRGHKGRDRKVSKEKLLCEFLFQTYSQFYCRTGRGRVHGRPCPWSPVVPWSTRREAEKDSMRRGIVIFMACIELVDYQWSTVNIDIWLLYDNSMYCFFRYELVESFRRNIGMTRQSFRSTITWWTSLSICESKIKPLDEPHFLGTPWFGGGLQTIQCQRRSLANLGKKMVAKH